MFEDIIGGIRYIEILYADNVWRLGRIKNLKPFFTFRYVNVPDVTWRAVDEPFIDEDNGWSIIASPVED